MFGSMVDLDITIPPATFGLPSCTYSSHLFQLIITNICCDVNAMYIVIATAEKCRTAYMFICVLCVHFITEIGYCLKMKCLYLELF